MSDVAERVIFIGPFPPPLHGQSMVTADLAGILEHNDVALNVVDTGRANYPANRVVQHAVASLAILAGGAHCYISLNSNRGMWLSAVLAGFARLRGIPLTLHHHSYAHMNERKMAMVALARFAGKAAVHIVLAERMASQLKVTTPEVGCVEILNNAGFVRPGTAASSAAKGSGQIVIGYLGNLTEEKGIMRAVEAAIALVSSGADIRLVVAGPPHDQCAKTALETARRALGDRFEYCGPVSGAEKEKFFDAIDLLIFPSVYRNEAQPLVLLECLSRGIPCLAYDIGCIADDLGEGEGGRTIPASADFTEACRLFVADYANRQARANASLRFSQLVALHKLQLARLLAALKGEHSQECAPTKTDRQARR